MHPNSKGDTTEADLLLPGYMAMAGSPFMEKRMKRKVDNIKAQVGKCYIQKTGN
jgi:hypothetical protein